MEFESNNIAEETNNNHRWQKVTYPKKQRKNPAKQQQQPAEVLSNGSSVSVVDNVFTSIENQSEERRKVIEAERLANLAIYDPAPPATSSKKNNYYDYDYSDEEVVSNGVGNGVTEEKKTKPKKVKKPKVTVPEAAAKIDAADLASFLSDVTEIDLELGCTLQM